MKTRNKLFSSRWSRLTMIAMVLALLALNASVALAAVSTDKQDYTPGETVVINGDGFFGSETIIITVNAPYGTINGETKANRGAFEWSFDLPADDSAHGWYSYSARGEKSGIVQAATFSDHGAGSPQDCITDNDPDTSFQVEVGGTTPNGSTAGEREIIINAASGYVVSSICIKSGNGTFDVEDPDGIAGTGDENSETGPSGSGTSAHSVEITADGTYGIDLEPGDGIDGCYVISGIGTSTVTVTAVGDGPDSNDSENCKDLSHGDVFTGDDNGGGGGGDQPDLEKTTDCPDEFPIYSTVAVECTFTITLSFPGGTPNQIVIADTIPREFVVDDLTPSTPTTASATPAGKGNGSTEILWVIPAGTEDAALVVDISTRKNKGKGHKAGAVFAPTSCGPLAINNGAVAFEDLDEDGSPDLNPTTLERIVFAGLPPSNVLVVQAVAGAQPCEVLNLDVTNSAGDPTGSLDLSWDANTEDDGTLIYYVYRDGELIATVIGATTFTDSGLAADSSYCYQINAAYAGDPENDGNHSNEDCETTEPEPEL